MSDKEPEKVTIYKSDYERLCKDSELLGYLEECGVDNWDGYSEARRAMRKAHEDVPQN